MEESSFTSISTSDSVPSPPAECGAPFEGAFSEVPAISRERSVGRTWIFVKLVLVVLTSILITSLVALA